MTTPHDDDENDHLIAFGLLIGICFALFLYFGAAL